mmetsp:Transcript_59491/g.134295  ORF Transcript_59491/g.134295 Transcript_59491/m.134295 type:complete len:474 (+) Transcript_59491:54-1475(+)|eukprot:CAMPEP_0204343416 /NCGR_PEP_ID=MMETSP0469-20131031/24889_1 /ASSEMBLY_ACC=CAM_ASM_000384 /TAXON_ID=2969 /ORGANISM="Oxyrrhis marina" /LENGTH=473 /DNA_ID=CAMNT_0051328517 /DNA_START=25 /DNA_END=1446 /DNA_ORIENTATION=+
MALSTPLAAPEQALMHAPDHLMEEQARSPAYRVLSENHLLESKYRIQNSSAIPLTPGNSSRLQNTLTCCIGCCGKQFVVPEGSLRPASSGDGQFFFYGPGVHSVANCYVSLSQKVPLTTTHIINGNQGIVTVQQGFIGLAEDRGQPVLLGPGLHYWKSDTMKFVRHIDLSSPVINMGPYTLVTVDEGYAAVTQDNGKQVVVPGGSVALLTHKNWKFEKFMSEKIQTDDIQQTVLQTADNVLLSVSATVTWNIVDVGLAARLAAQTMGVQNAGADVVMPKLRVDVLKQALASLSAFVGSQRYSDSFGVATVNAGHGRKEAAPLREPEGEDGVGVFDSRALASSVEHCNEITLRYGVRVSSVNVISATPADPNLTTQLAAAAVAAAAAEKAEIEASGLAKAKLISARADADAERTRASGAKDAADKLESSPLAVELSKIQRVGEALQGNSTMFFGASASDLPGIFANNQVVRASR